jgi:hypothetical protein
MSPPGLAMIALARLDTDPGMRLMTPGRSLREMAEGNRRL